MFLQSSTAVANYKNAPKVMEKVKFFLQDSLNSESVKSLNKSGLTTFLSCLAPAACGYFEYSIIEPCSVVKRLRSKPIFFKADKLRHVVGWFFFFLSKVFPKFLSCSGDVSSKSSNENSFRGHLFGFPPVTVPILSDSS